MEEQLSDPEDCLGSINKVLKLVIMCFIKKFYFYRAIKCILFETF